MGKVFDAWQAAVDLVPEDALVTVKVDKTLLCDIYDVELASVKFSYRRVKQKYSLIFNGESELIDVSTYYSFIAKANAFMKENGKEVPPL